MSARSAAQRSTVVPGQGGRAAEPADDRPGPAEATASATRGGGFPHADRWGWFGVTAITVVVAATWARFFVAPFGDNHDGRVIGRYALQMQNLYEKGFAASHWGADWSPYADEAYAHHPPLLTVLNALFTGLPGDAEFQVRSGSYLLALLAIPAAAALLRGFRIGWPATLLSVGLMAATGYYWLVSPIMCDIGLILALAASIVHLRQSERPSRSALAIGCGFALLATLGSWPGIAFAAVLGLWLFTKRRLDRVTALIGVAMVTGVLLSAAFMVGVNGIDGLTAQTEYRTAGGDFTARAWIRRQIQWAGDMLPVWYLVLLPFGLFAGVVVRRTRYLVTVSAVFAVAWVAVLNNGSWNHDYWGYLVLVPGVVGIGVLLDAGLGRLRPRAGAITAGAAAVALAVGFGTMAFGATARDYLADPGDAGRVASAVTPPPGQQRAWHRSVSAPRWLSFYWGLMPAQLQPEHLDGLAGHPDDLVLLDIDRLPPWIPPTVVDRAVRHEGDYAVVRVGDIRALTGR